MVFSAIGTQVSKMALKRSLNEVEVKDFVVPEVALEYIESEWPKNQEDEEQKTILFLANSKAIQYLYALLFF
jgi:hypothetical protein